jgi:hypothetical protein
MVGEVQTTRTLATQSAMIAKTNTGIGTIASRCIHGLR